mmetsp:Transcript_1197/g.3360  ORF Transcript_1197/g.3360 Transcript_1197/m.3360 type:complete len:441 (+) Transcript_1197:13-1335(+)
MVHGSSLFSEPNKGDPSYEISGPTFTPLGIHAGCSARPHYNLPLSHSSATRTARASVVAPLDAVLRGQIFTLDGPGGAVVVGLRLELVVVLHGEQGGREDVPRDQELVVADEEGLLAVDDVEDEALVSVGDVLGLLPGGPVEEVEARLVEPGGEAGNLAGDFEVDGLVGLDADDELVAVHVAGAKDVARDLLEPDADFGLALVQGLAGLHEEGDAVPAAVVDVEDARRKGGAARGVGDVGVVEVALALAGGAVLAEDEVFGRELLDAAEELDLLVSDILRVQRQRSLHADESENLQKMVLHDVADDADVVKVACAALDSEIFLEGDLDALDVVAVPDGLENGVGKPESHEVLHKLLPEVVIDAVGLVLGELLSDFDAHLRVRLGIAAEGLLDDDAGPAVGCACALVDAGDGFREDGGGHCEVEEAVRADVVPVGVFRGGL